MNLNLTSRRPTAGSTMLLTLVITGLVGFVLVAYLQLVKAQNMSTMRSQAWNATIPVIEAGIEEALAHLGAHAGGSLACDGWYASGTTYVKFRRVGDHFYLVSITNYFPGVLTNAPIIESRGYVNLPTMAAVALPGPMLATAPNYATYRNYLGRGVQVQTCSDALFTKGLVAKDTIDLNGNNILADSFDSLDTNSSIGGRYSSTRRKANGDVATNSSLTNSLNVGNADIFGRVATGPNGSVAIGPQGSVGDLAWHIGNNRGIKPGFYKDDMNVEFPPVGLPFSGGAFTPGGGHITNGSTVTYYDYILDDGNYELPSLSGKTFVRGDAVLLVKGSIFMSGHDEIVINTNKTLKLYMAGASADLGGNGVINYSGFATNFSYLGLPSNTTLNLSGNGEIIGTVYAPNANLTLNGGGHSNTDFVGASISKNARLNGHFSFHYDEMLGRFGPIRGFVITAWDEMTPEQVGQMVLSLPF